MIHDIRLQVIFNSKGEKTVEATIIGDSVGIASAPSGISESSFAAKRVPLNVGIRNFRRIKKELLGQHTQESFDSLLKKNMNRLGSNVTTSLSLAFFNMDPDLDSQRFPYPLGNVLGGGAHGMGIRIQEILVLPVKAKTIFQAIETNFRIFREVGESLSKHVFVGQTEESAWSSPITDERALETVYDIARRYGARMGIDLAASQFYNGSRYKYALRNLDKEEQVDIVSRWIHDYNLYYIEDPFHENDFVSFAELRKKFRNKLICGDDLIASHISRLKTALRYGSCNSIIVKPNQVGTVTDTLTTIDYALKHKVVPVMSHRSAETTDTTPAYLSLKTPLCKFGVAGIRIAMLNELIRIWNLSKKPRMAKW